MGRSVSVRGGFLISLALATAFLLLRWCFQSTLSLLVWMFRKIVILRTAIKHRLKYLQQTAEFEKLDPGQLG